MPLLKDLSCSIELSEGQEPLQELGTSYGDGFVETFVPVPSKSQSFSIHLTSNKFIAPGIAIFVYVDGVYQCNRNRQDLKLRKPFDSRSLVDFRVRQKEERQRDGSMTAREWTFEKLNIALANDAPNVCSPNILDNIGCIEVVVLRCAGSRSAKTASTMNLDGASDFPDHHFGLDGYSSPTDERSMYDDRGPLGQFNSNYGPPPPIFPARSPYAETVRSHEDAASRSRHTAHTTRESPLVTPTNRHSRARSTYFDGISPGTRQASNLPPPGFQYGSGPIPPAEPIQQRPASAIITNAPRVDSIWLNQLLTTAVKQGVEESRRIDEKKAGHSAHSKRAHDHETTSQPPGAWPTSPFVAATQPHAQFESATVHTQDEHHGTTWGQSQDFWEYHPGRSRKDSRVTWNVEPVWEASSNANGWDSQEETPSDSWDTNETWANKKSNGWEPHSDNQQYGPRFASAHVGLQPEFPVTARSRNVNRSKRSPHRKSRSNSHTKRSRRKDDITSSSSDNEGWTRVDTAPYSVASLESSDDTLQPVHSRTQVHPPRNRSEKHSHRSTSERNNDERKSAVVPPPCWGPAGSQKVPHNGSTTTSKAPAPYASSLHEFVRGVLGGDPKPKAVASLASWNHDNKAGVLEDSWDDTVEKEYGWRTTEDAKWEKLDTKEPDVNDWEGTDDDQNCAWYEKWNIPKDIGEKKKKTTSTSAWPAPRDESKLVKGIETPWETHSWNNGNNFNKVQWNTTTPEKSTKGAPTHRHSNKTLSKYRQVRSTVSDSAPKPHWQFPPPASEKKMLFSGPEDRNSSKVPYIAPKEPLYIISKEIASEKGIEHQVRAGKATQYGHAVRRPEYLDRLDAPYAVFRFKYRSTTLLKTLFGDKFTDPSSSSTPLTTSKDRLKNLPQDELIDKMLKLQMQLEHKTKTKTKTKHGEGDGKSRDKHKRKSGEKREKEKGRRESESKTEVVARGLTESWVEQQSREASVGVEKGGRQNGGWDASYKW